MEQAVRALAVGERRLECIGALGQSVLDDRLHAHLAEGAARLLVGQDLLKADHVAGEVRQILLRRVDHRQPLVELGDGFMRLARRVVEVGAHLVGHAVEPLVDGPRQLAVTADADLGQGLQPHLELAHLSVAGGRFALAPAHMHDEDDGEQQQRKDAQAR
ncbi:hypothetical protein AUC69_05070 [Methyloceanibacter superfactus]|uniref:Uncharacterized protein n=1 Tax=Methyloceanibacter superfactus TaxID=1774969 RepID=A0A1E3W7A6_9HYPH|nr:hypothetical protein AUC69_05070 [Methyloceanibacter superfactus]